MSRDGAIKLRKVSHKTATGHYYYSDTNIPIHIHTHAHTHAHTHLVLC